MIKAIALFSLWASASVSLIFLNSYLLNNGYPNPIFVSATGQVFTATYGLVASFSREKLKALNEEPRARLKLLAIGACCGYTLFASNAAYMYLSVAFAQILKACNPVITGIILATFRVQKVNAPAFACLFVMTLGTMIAVNGKQKFSLAGVALLLSAEVAECGKIVLTQTLLQNENLEKNLVAATSSALAVALMLPAAFARETPLVGFAARAPWLVVAGALGCATTLSAAEIIKRHSSLTLKAAAQVRNAAVVYGSAAVSLVSLTSQQCLGYLVVIVSYYLYVKNKN